MKINKILTNFNFSDNIIMIFTACFVLSTVFCLRHTASAGTYLILDENASGLGSLVQFDDTTALEDDFTALAIAFFDDNKEALPTGFAAANSLGYPNGISLRKPFPHFECGASVGGSVYKYNRINDFDKNDIEHNPSVPGGGINGGFFFGTAVNERIDVLAKFFSIRWFTSKTYDYDSKAENLFIELNDYDVYSFGVKPRYNILKSRDRSLLSFGGLSVNLSLDYMKYMFTADMKYGKSKEQDFKIHDPFGGGDTTQEVVLDGVLDGSVTMNSNFYSVTPEFFVYLNMLYILNFYTGPSVSFTTGSMEMNVDCSGKLKNLDSITVNSYVPDLELVPAGTDLATARLVSKNKMHPTWVIPRWTIGFEISLWVLNIEIEASSILTSITDSATAQVGLSLRI